jgi:hypothetical protein
MPTFKSPVFGVASLRSPGKATFLVGSELNGLTLFVTRRLASEICHHRARLRYRQA